MRSRRFFLTYSLALLAACSQENATEIIKPIQIKSESLAENSANSPNSISPSSKLMTQAQPSKALLKAIDLLPAQAGQPAGLIVGLHGWGSNPQDLASVAPSLNLPNYRQIFPEGPMSHPRVVDGKMWYDLDRTDYKGLTESRQLLKEYLTNLAAETEIGLDRTILLGFSQGGAMTLDVGLSMPLAGLICLSGYLHPITQVLNSSLPPILIIHGTQDQVVPLSIAQQGRDTLTKLGANVAYAEYDMGHEIKPPALERVRQFILEQT